MKFSVSKEVFGQFRGFSVGVVIAEDIRNKKSSDELDELISEIVGLVSTNFNQTDFANSQMISPWKSAYFDYEEKPHTTHSSVERLTKEVMDTGDIKRKNRLKDLCSFISLKHTVPVECFDIEHIQGGLSLKRAAGNEFFYDAGSKKSVNPEKGEFIYSDGINVLARKLDYIESDKASVSESTKKAVILIEGLTPLSKSEVKNITKEAADLVKTFCKAKVSSFVLDEKNSEAEF
jgi:DNA/RNA-binding domain of Phe-tRNA-synthetase-like protein